MVENRARTHFQEPMGLLRRLGLFDAIMNVLIDLHYSTHVHIAEQLSLAVFSQFGPIARRAESLLAANSELVRTFLKGRVDISAIAHEERLITFPRILNGDVEQLCKCLREDHQTSVVPGRFFEMPDHIRIGLGRETSTLNEGLTNIGRVLDKTNSRSKTA